MLREPVLSWGESRASALRFCSCWGSTQAFKGSISVSVGYWYKHHKSYIMEA